MKVHVTQDSGIPTYAFEVENWRERFAILVNYEYVFREGVVPKGYIIVRRTGADHYVMWRWWLVSVVYALYKLRDASLPLAIKCARKGLLKLKDGEPMRFFWPLHFIF